MPDVPAPASPDVAGREKQLRSAVDRALALSDTAAADFDLTRAHTAWNEAEVAYSAVKAALLLAAGTSAITLPELDVATSHAASLRSIGERTVTAAGRIKSTSGGEPASPGATVEEATQAAEDAAAPRH